MLTVEQIDLSNKKQVNEFLQLPFRLYKNHPQWVPPFIDDIRLMMNKQKHPFYELNDADFFAVYRDGKMVSRIAAMENRSFNDYHKVKKAQFYLFETENDQEAVNALFARVFEWAKARGLDTLVGPKGFSAFDGYGIQVEGFELRQMMTMMNYNYDYYPKLVEAIGFEKEVDFVSCYLARENFTLPEKAQEIARRIEERGTFKVLNFKNKRQIIAMAQQIGEAYNATFVNNWEYYPLTKGEIKLLLDNLLSVVDPKLIKIITYNEKIVGFLLAFPDISAALQRQGGKITPWGIIDMLLEMKRTKWVSLNGVGVLPEYHGRGGAALMYSEMEKTIKDFGFDHAELTQVAETAVQMRKDLINVGGRAYKNHRIYRIKF
jgi:GNAT superfamily N-acetyltransferase